MVNISLQKLIKDEVTQQLEEFDLILKKYSRWFFESIL